MTTQYRVLDEYTDEYLKARIKSVLDEGRSSIDPFVVATWTLLGAPADWRQSIAAAAHNRAYEIRRSSNGVEMKFPRPGVSYFDALRQEVSRFHGGQRPPRMESPLEIDLEETPANDQDSGYAPDAAERVAALKDGTLRPRQGSDGS